MSSASVFDKCLPIFSAGQSERIEQPVFVFANVDFAIVAAVGVGKEGATLVIERDADAAASHAHFGELLSAQRLLGLGFAGLRG